MKLDGYIEHESATKKRNTILQRIIDEETESFNLKAKHDRSIRNSDSKEARRERLDHKLHM